MNRIYRLVVNHSLGLIQVASELGSARGKTRAVRGATRSSRESAGTAPTKTSLAAALALTLLVPALAMIPLPTQAATVALIPNTGHAGGAGGSGYVGAPGAGGTGAALGSSSNDGGQGGTAAQPAGFSGYSAGMAYGVGGRGGKGVYSSALGAFVDGGGGGGGGQFGAYLPAGSYSLASGTGSIIRGGAGGNGGYAAYGYGGFGGSGAPGVYGKGFTLTNSGNITGGNGGIGGADASSNPHYARGGDGGHGVVGSGFTLINNGTVGGGYGGAGDYANGFNFGRGGFGIVAYSGSSITNSGLIAGGLGQLGGGYVSPAIYFNGGGNTLTLLYQSMFSNNGLYGNVISSSGTYNGGDTLELGGIPDATLTGTLSSGAPSYSWSGAPVFYGFQNLLKTGASHWTIHNGSGTNAIPNWDVEAGVLKLSSGDSFTASGSTDTLTFGIQATSSTAATPGVDNGEIVVPAYGNVFFNGEPVTIQLAPGTYAAGVTYTLMTASSFDAAPGLTFSPSLPSGMSCTDSTSSGTSLTLTCASGGTIGASSSGGGGAFGLLSMFGLMGLAGLGRKAARSNRKPGASG